MFSTRFIDWSQIHLNLNSLEVLNDATYKDEIVELISGSKKMNTLQTLIFIRETDSYFSKSLNLIACSEHLKNLTKLSLRGYEVEDEDDVKIFVNSSNMKQLRELKLECCNITNTRLFPNKIILEKP